MRSQAVLPGFLFLVPGLFAQDPAASRPLTREQMWFAPTAEDWKRPVRITFQRTWEDAVAVSRETKKAILVCINMDGEIASEHYAGVRYRQPEIAALYEPYVCVIASVYRHNPRDHDEQGRRIPCPRFGCVTCGEHIAIEPILYEKFMDGRRIAPRHIMVELDGQETYDVFYANDTDSVFRAIKDGIGNRKITPPPVVRGDRSLVERVASQDVLDRVVVEQAWQQGDLTLRRSLLEAAAANLEAAPVELLRQGVFSFDADLNQIARRTLAQARSPSATDVIADALRVPMPAAERDALVQALERIGEASPRARTLAVVHQGLAHRSNVVDVEGWAKELAAQYRPASESDLLTMLERVDAKTEQSKAKPTDAAARLELAESLLAQAVDPQTTRSLAADPKTAPKFLQLMLEDARRAALEAEKLGATGWRVNAAVALAERYLGNEEAADARAEAAVTGMPAQANEWNAFAALELFAHARQRAIVKAARDKQPWPRKWLTDVHAAYSVLARHPLGNDTQVADHYDFVKALGGTGQATRILEAGLQRFTESKPLHARLRAQVLDEKGAAGLEPAYDALLQRQPSPGLESQAGYATILAAEFHRRAGKPQDALAAYDRAIARFERCLAADPTQRTAADHYIAVALAGKARLALELEDYERSLADLLASFARGPDSAATPDGLNLSAVDTARMLRARLAADQRGDLVKTLDAALARLDPELLRLPAYERETPEQPQAPTGRRRR
jgi:hypothetical protein